MTYDVRSLEPITKASGSGTLMGSVNPIIRVWRSTDSHPNPRAEEEEGEPPCRD